MAAKYMQLVLTPAVQKAQDRYFGKHQVVEHAPETDSLTRSEAYFIASRDSFYTATVSETGWPSVQQRGGPPGFVKVLGPDLIGFADFEGNRELVSTGNLGITDRVALFMMDYPTRTRLKLLGHARDARRARESRACRSTRPRTVPPEGGAVVPDPGHFLRLELPAIHHSTLHRRRDGKECRTAESPDHRVGNPTRRARQPGVSGPSLRTGGLSHTTRIGHVTLRRVTLSRFDIVCDWLTFRQWISPFSLGC
jgi:predicted pyridoxine 5'-phosphate oxidase superfamily flavin-nucleotide-binding protein